MNDQAVNNNTSSNVNAVFWIIGVIALLWNLMGVFNFLGQMMVSEEALVLMSEGERALYESSPMWLNVIFAIAVFAGVLGSIGLLMKRKWCIQLFLVSLVAIVIQFGFGVFTTNAVEVLGVFLGIGLPIMVTLYAAFLYYYAKKCAVNGWLR